MLKVVISIKFGKMMMMMERVKNDEIDNNILRHCLVTPQTMWYMMIIL